MKTINHSFINFIEGTAMKKYFVTLFVVLFMSVSANAQNFNDALRLSDIGISGGARSLAMGNAYTALSNDFSASIFNPAGFGLIKKTELSTGFNYNSFDNNTAFFNSKTDLNNSVTKFSEAGITLPFPTTRGSFVVSIGYNQLKDFNKVLGFSGYNPNNNSYIQDLTSYNDDLAFKLALSYPTYDANNKYLNDVTVINGGLNQRGIIRQEGALNSWSFSGALEVDQNLFVGATVNIYSGTFKRTKDYYEEDLLNNYPSSVLLDPSEPGSADFKSFNMKDVIDWELSGSGLKLGALFKLNDNVNLGATIKLPTTYTVKESYSSYGTSLFGTGRTFTYNPNPENYEYEISSPAEFSLGGAYTLKNLTLSGNATLIDYSKMEFKGGFNNSAVMNKNSDIVNMMRSVVNLNAGAEYLLSNNKIALRAGFMLMPSAFKDDPSDYDKKYLTAGVGYNFSRSSSINFAYVYGWWKDIGDNYGVNVSRTFQDIKYQNFVTSLKFTL